MENVLNQESDLNITNNNQQEFFQSTLGKIIDFSLDAGIRALVPDIIENEVINIKDTIISEGFSEGIKSLIDNAINMGKSALGIVTGEFESVSQAEKAIEKGGILDSISSGINLALNKISSMGIISEDTTNLIANGKDVIINNVSSNIKKEFTTQSKNIDNLNSYVNKWKLEYENRNIEGMEKYMKKIDKTLSKTLPIENLINEARTIENIHELIKNNGNNFDLSKEELDLASKLN